MQGIFHLLTLPPLFLTIITYACEILNTVDHGNLEFSFGTLTFLSPGRMP